MKQKRDGQKSYRHADHISWRKVGEDAVLLDQNTSLYFSINNVGALIWERLGAGTDLASIREEICREFSVEPERAQKHMDEFIQELCAKNVLVPL
ncbi:MAG: PqqD family protein [Elusimicrobiota bacterium]|jgi:hypothetical protein